jgi:hypothetical protein
LDFANFERDSDELFEVYQYIFSQSSVLLSEHEGKSWHLRQPTVFAPTIEKLREDQSQLCHLLDELRRDGPTPSFWEELTELVGDDTTLLGDVSLSAQPGRLRASIDIVPADISQWYGFALSELVSRGLGDRVRRCEWKPCGQFFLALNKHGPARKYCCGNHGAYARMKKMKKERGRR